VNLTASSDCHAHYKSRKVRPECCYLRRRNRKWGPLIRSLRTLGRTFRAGRSACPI